MPRADPGIDPNFPHDVPGREPNWPLPGCPNPRPATVLVVAPDRVLVRDGPCNNWRCSYCRQINAYRLRKRLVQIRPTRLLTLTWRNTQPETPTQAYYAMSSALSKLIKRLKRLWPAETIRYVAVCESTEKGWPHFHILIECPYIRQRKLSAIWKALTNSPIVDIRRIYDPEKTAKYLTKYLTKAPAVPPHCRHFRASRGYLPPYIPTHKLRDGQPCMFKVSKERPSTVATRLLMRGYILLSAKDPWPFLELLEPTTSNRAGVESRAITLPP